MLPRQRQQVASAAMPAVNFRSWGHWRLVTADLRAPRSSAVHPGVRTEGSNNLAIGRQHGPREGSRAESCEPSRGLSWGMRFSTLAHRHCETAIRTSSATRAGGSFVRTNSMPSAVTMVRPSRNRQPRRAMVANVAVAGPLTTAHGFFAAVRRRTAHAAVCKSSDVGTQPSHTHEPTRQSAAGAPGTPDPP